MKKNSNTIILILGLMMLVSCSKEENNVAPTTEEEATVATTNYPSPCSSNLTDNQVECSPNVFPNSTVNPTVVLSGDSKEMNGTVSGFPQGGDINIRFGAVISAGVYALVDNASLSASQANIAMTPSVCSICPFRSTSGELYVTETSTHWIAEWCSVNFNSMTVTPNSYVTGRMIVTK